MGNLATRDQQKSFAKLQDAFKNFEKKGPLGGPESLTSNTTDLLQFDDLDVINGIYDYIIKEMRVSDEFANNPGILSSNIQRNEGIDDLEAHLAKKALTEANASFMCGFKTSESNIEDLKHPSYERFFTVMKDQAQSEEYRSLQLKKMAILYCLCQLQSGSSSQKKTTTTFSEFVAEFLMKDVASQRAQTGLNFDSGFLLSVLRQLKDMNNGELLLKTLEHLAMTLRKASPGVLFKGDKMSYVLDDALNEGRSFLVDLIQDIKSTKKVRNLSYQILVLLGTARNSVDDLLNVCTLLQKKKPADVDLRSELQKLRQKENQEAQEDLEITLQNQSDKPINLPSCSFGINQLNPNLYNACTFDGEYIYVLYATRGLQKISIGNNGMTPGKIIAINTNIKSEDAASMMHFKDSIYLRTKEMKPSPFVRIDKNTLKEVKMNDDLKFEPNEGENQSLQQTQEDESGRSLLYTPMITDGNFMYVISRFNPPKPSDEDFNEADFKTQFVVEIYDPAKGFEFVRQVTLMKKNQPKPFSKSGNSEEWLQRSKWCTNGSLLAVFSTSPRKLRFFSLKTGKRVQKISMEEQFICNSGHVFEKRNADNKPYGAVCNGCRGSVDWSKGAWHCPTCRDDICSEKCYYKYKGVEDMYGIFLHDHIFNSFIKIGSSKGIAQIEKYTMVNFNMALQEETEDEVMVKLEQQLLEQNESADSAAQLSSLNLIEKIMQGVTNQQIVDEQEQLQGHPFNSEIKPQQIAGMSRSLILQHIASKCFNFTKFYHSDAQKPKKTCEDVMNMFRYPSVTYLTSSTFKQLGEGLAEGCKLLNEPINEDNLHDLHALYYMTQIVLANIQALNYCSINLSNLLPKEADYSAFKTAFQGCVKTLADESDEDLNKRNQKASEKVKRVWKQIAEVCQKITTVSVRLFFKGSHEILQQVHQFFEAGQGQQSLPQVSFLSQAEILKGVLNETLQKEGDQMNDILEVFQHIAKQDRGIFHSKLKHLDINKPESVYQDSKQYDFCQIFISRFGQIMLFEYCGQTQAILPKRAQKNSQKSDADLEQEKKDEMKLGKVKKIIEKVIEITFDELSSSFDLILGSLQKQCEAQEQNTAPENETEFAKNYTEFSSEVSRVFQEHRAFYSLAMMLVQTFCVNSGTDYDLTRAICQSSKKAIKSMSLLTTIWDKFGQKLRISKKPSSETQDQSLEQTVNMMRTHLNWYLGMIYYDLIKSNKSVETEEKKDGSQEQQDQSASKTKITKEQRQKQVLKNVLDSNLLSGGVEFQHLQLFSKESKKSILGFAKLMEDQTLIQAVSDIENKPMKSADNFADNMLEAIITKGLNKDVDLTIDFLQKILETGKAQSGPPLPKMKLMMLKRESSVGGASGMRMSRAAFAVIVKFSDLFDEFSYLVDFLAMQLESKKDTTPEEDDEIIKKMKESFPKSKDLLKNWQSASRMRQWINEKKQSIIEKEESKLSQEIQKQKKKKLEEKKAEKKDGDQIDSSATTELTLEEKDHVYDGAFKVMEKELDEIFDKITNKAMFLITLNIPPRFKRIDPTLGMEDGSSIQILKKKSFEKFDNEKLDWAERLNSWKQNQTSKGAIQSLSSIKSQIWDFGITSIIALLQTPITSEVIVKQVEKIYVDSLRRSAGFKLMRDLIVMEMPQRHLIDMVNWFNAALRNNQNRFTHYLDDIHGQGTHIENFTRRNFFDILGHLVKKMKSSTSEKEIKTIMHALKWKYQGQDHGELANMNIFKALHLGNGDPDNMLRKAWGRKIAVDCCSSDDQSLQVDVLEMFEQLFFTVTARLVESDFGEELKLKDQENSKGAVVRKAKSVLDQKTSDPLVGQAFEIIFQEIDRYNAMMSGYTGIDWTVYVRMRNLERKNGKSPQELRTEGYCANGHKMKVIHHYPDMYPDGGYVRCNICGLTHLNIQHGFLHCNICQFDVCQRCATIDQTNQQEKELKIKLNFKNNSQEEVQLQLISTTEDGQKEICKLKAGEEVSKEILLKTIISVNGGEGNDNCYQIQAKKTWEPKLEDDRKTLSIHKSNDDSVVQEEIDSFVANDQDREKRELQLLAKVYSETFLKRLLRMVEIFTSIATTSSRLLSMVQKVANPKQICTLLTLLLVASPSVKTIVLKILQNIVQIQIPFQIFEESVRLLTSDKKSWAYDLVHNCKAETKFDKCLLFKLLFNYLYSLRSKMWSSQDLESDGLYAVSQSLSQTLRVLSSIKETNEESLHWNSIMKEEIINALLKIEKLPLDESDTVFSLFGGEYGALVAGDKALTNKNQVVTILGYSSTWKTPQELLPSGLSRNETNKILKSLVLSPELTDAKQMAVALFYEKARKERQDMMLLHPSSLSPLMSFDEEQAIQTAKSSPIMNAKVFKHLITILKKSNEFNSDLSQSEKANLELKQAQILKIISSQVTQMGHTFVEFLQKENCFKDMLDFLQESGKNDQKSTQVIPIKWLEAKIQKMRKIAIETSKSLSLEATNTQVKLLEGQELLFVHTDPNSQTINRTNVFLTSAVNLHMASPDQVYSCCSAKETRSLETHSKTLLKNQLVMVDIADLQSLQEETLEILNSSEAILTAHPKDISIEKLYKKLYNTYVEHQVKAQENKFENANKYSNILQTIIYFVSEEDYLECTTLNQAYQCEHASKKKLDLDYLLDELKEWGGVESDQVLFKLGEENLSNISSIMTQVEQGLIEINEEELKFKEELDRFDKNCSDSGENLGLKIEQENYYVEGAYICYTCAKECRKSAQKKESHVKFQCQCKFLEGGCSMTKDDEAKQKLIKSQEEKKAKRIAESQKMKNAYEELLTAQDLILTRMQSKADTEVQTLFDDFTRDETWMSEIQTIAKSSIATKPAQQSSTSEKQLKEGDMTKQLCQIMDDFDATQINLEHAKAIEQIISLLKKSCLYDLINNSDLNELLPVLFETPKSQLQFSDFLKIRFNTSVIQMLQIGQKSNYKDIKQKMKHVFDFCSKSDKLKSYVKKFLIQVLEGGIKTFKEFKDEKPKKLVQHFQSEDRAINGLNPYLLSFFTSYLVKTNSKELLNISYCIPNLLNLHLGMIVYFQDEKKVIVKLLKSILKLVEYSKKNIAHLIKCGELKAMVQNKLLKTIIKEIDYTDQSSDQKFFTDQQLILLEVSLKIDDLLQEAKNNHGVDLVNSSEYSKAVCDFKTNKMILTENDTFDMLLYTQLLDSLDQKDKDKMNVKIETHHPAFDLTTRASVTIPGVENLSIKFRDNTKLKEFSSVAFSTDLADVETCGMTMKTSREATGEFSWPAGNIQLVYPLLKQSLVGLGSNAEDRMGKGEYKSLSGALCPIEDAHKGTFHPVKLQGIGSHYCMALSDKNELFESGYLESAGRKTAFTKASLKAPVRLIASSHYSATVVLEDNTIWYKGSSDYYHFPGNESKATFTQMKLWENPAQEDKIVKVVNGLRISLFLTESGVLWGMGKQFLKIIDQESETPVKIKLPENKVCRNVWCSGDSERTVIVDLEDTVTKEKHLYSAGESDRGMLGQKEGCTLSKTWGKVFTTSDDQKFVDVSIGLLSVLAVDNKGLLWGWGSNKFNKIGIEVVPDYGFKVPQECKALNDLKMKVKKICQGNFHSLVLFEDDKGNDVLYSVGTKADGEYHMLGVPSGETNDTTKPFREIVSYKGREIVDFIAHKYSTLLILGGAKKFDINRSVHHLPGDKSATGLIHFYKKGDEWVFLSEDEYKEKKNEIPDICFATKYPIDDIPSKEWPDLVALAQEVIDQGSKDQIVQIHEDFHCSTTGVQIKGPLYQSKYKLNNTDVLLNFNEESVAQDDQYSINPMIFLRISKKLKKGAILPQIDLTKYFKVGVTKGLEIDVVPDLSRQKNDHLIKTFQEKWNEIVALDKEFDVSCTREFLKELDKQIKDLLGNARSIGALDMNSELKFDQLKFQNEKLKGLSEKAVKQKASLYCKLNAALYSIMPFSSQNLQSMPGSVAQLILKNKACLFASMKNKKIDQVIQKLPKAERERMDVSRLKASTYRDTGKVDHTGEFTLFGQMFTKCKEKPALADCFRMNTVEDKAFKFYFEGENSDDWGGPFREVLTNIVQDELETDVLPLLLKTPNNRNNFGENRDGYLPNSSSNTPTYESMFKFLGHILGFTIRTKQPLDWHFPPFFWKQLLGQPHSLADLNDIDTFSYDLLKDMRTKGEIQDAGTFESMVHQNFVTYLNDGQEFVLCPGGQEKMVTHANHKEFIDLVINTKLSQAQKQMQWIKEGINHVIDLGILSLLTWEEIQTRACGEKLITVQKLKSITEYNRGEDQEIFQWFWKMFEEFTQEERAKYLQFIWGRNKLPSDCSNLEYKHQLRYYSSHTTDKLPLTHTCFFQIDIPPYSSYEIMVARFKTAIEFCGEIDTD